MPHGDDRRCSVSMKLMVRVLEEADLSRPQQAVLLAMAENANDDGSRCFPSVDLIAWKAGYKPRAVVDIMRELRQMQVISIVKDATARRPTEYHIHIENAPRKITFEEWQELHGRHAKSVRRGAFSRDVQSDEGCNLTSLGVQSHVKTTRENAPDPVIDPVDPVNTPRTTNLIRIDAPSAKASTAVLMERFERWYIHYPKKRNRGQAEKTWLKIAPSEELTDQLIDAVTVASRSKEWTKDDGQFIPNPSTWLNAKGWLDDICVAPPAPPVELLPGETAVEVAPDCWDLTDHGGRKRRIRPEYHGVIFDERHHQYSGLQDFYDAVNEAKAREDRIA